MGKSKMFVTGLVVGGLLAGAVAGVVFRNRTSRDAARKVKKMLGMDKATQQEDALQALYSISPERREPVEDWGGVPSPTFPQWRVRRGYDVKLIAKGFDYPVNIAFATQQRQAPDAPWFYVNELHGSVKYFTRDGKIGVFAEGLKNFDPIDRDGTDQTGLSGLITLPDSEDLLLTHSYRDETSGLLKNRVVRLVSKPGGKELARVDTLLDLDEFTSPAHQIQQLYLADDDTLYVSVGDGENASFAQNRNRWAGKIIRMNLDGSPCEDNPFYDESYGREPINYVWAFGLRNVFDFDVEPSTGVFYAADNGYRIDRVLVLRPGIFHGWNGHPRSTRLNALFSWGGGNNLAPTGFTFLRKPVLGPKTRGRMFVGAWNQRLRKDGRRALHGQAILELNIDPKTQTVLNMPVPLIQYNGEGLATVSGIEEGPDGLYFADFTGETTDWTERGQGAIWRVVEDEATLKLRADPESDLADLEPVQRGWLYFQQNCSICHTVAGFGGREGPDLSHARTDVIALLNSPGYLTELDRLLASEETFFKEQRPRLQAVKQATGEQRMRIWLRHHLEEPRFDNPLARMPSFITISEEKRNDIITFVMTLK